MTATEQRFQAARAHPETTELLARVPDGEEKTGLHGILGSLAAVTLFVMLGLLFTVGLAAVFPPLALVPIATVAVGLVFYGLSLFQQWTRKKAPLERHLALVVAEETQVKDADGGNARTTYFFTLEYGDGSRALLHSDGEPSGGARTGDIGVAFQRADVLIQFERVPV